jgi:hypothetical protein
VIGLEKQAAFHLRGKLVKGAAAQIRQKLRFVR